MTDRASDGLVGLVEPPQVLQEPGRYVNAIINSKADGKRCDHQRHNVERNIQDVHGPQDPDETQSDGDQGNGAQSNGFPL